MSKKAILSWLSLVTVIVMIVYGPMVAAAAAAKIAEAGNPASSMNSSAASSKSAENASASSVQVRRVGEVTAYSPGLSITIIDHKGDFYTFTLATALKIVPSSRASQLGVGAFVTVIAPANSPNNKQIAVGIVIHRGAPGGFPPPVPTTVTPSDTPTNTVTHTPTNTNTPTNTPTHTPTNTATNTPSNTPTHTATNTPTNTPTHTATYTPTNTPTITPTYTPSNTPTGVSNVPVAPIIPEVKPDIANPSEWSQRTLSTIVAYTFPSDINGVWTIPLKAAAFEDIQPASPDGFTEVGMVEIGLDLELQPDSSPPPGVCESASKKGNGSNAEIHRHGIVVDYVEGGESITIVDRDGNPYKFIQASPLKVNPPHRADQLRPGAFVTVIAPANEPNNKQTAVGVVIHKGVPGCFPIPDSIMYVVQIDVASTSDTVQGRLVSPAPGTDVIDVAFDRIPQVINDERTYSPYSEFQNLDSSIKSAATIAANGVCFVVNDSSVIGSGPVRYCSTSETAPVIAFKGFNDRKPPFLTSALTALTSLFTGGTPVTSTDSTLSVIDSFPVQYADLQDRMSAAADRIDYGSPIDTNQIISTIEDAQRIRDCANATEANRQALCSSDIIVVPVTPAYFLDEYGDLLSLSFPLSAPTTLDVGIVKILVPIEVPTVSPAGSFTVQPGDYRLDYWFDVNGVFYASTLTGLADDDTPVFNLQAPALPGLFIDAVGFQQPISQISACRISRWCIFEGGCN